VKAWLVDLWNGRVPLARAFWEYAIIYGSALSLIFTLASLFAFSQDWHTLGIAFFLTPVPYNLLMVVAVWRSAARYEGAPIWSTLARALIIVWAAIASLA